MTKIDETHDQHRRSWVTSAEGHPEFPLQNLPFGVFRGPDGPRIGIAIGEAVLDVRQSIDAGVLPGLNDAVRAALRAPRLNALMALGGGARRAVRREAFDLLAAETPPVSPDRLLYPMADCDLLLPADIGDFTDFYAGIHHATNAARRRNPDKENPLAENYKFVPVGYHSRTSSVLASGATVNRPMGQRKRVDDPTPNYGPSRLLDYELELGSWIGPGNPLGEAIAISTAADHLWGLCLLNDLSARDIQRWESQPLGPFLGKNFGTVVSPWIVTPEALAPFRVAQPERPAGDPLPLPHLLDADDQAAGAFDVTVEAFLSTEVMRTVGLPEHRLSRANTTDLYWTVAQFIAHHTSGGCNLRPGDLFGSGTISGPTESGYGSLNEVTFTGTRPLTLPSREERLFLEEGDEVIFRGHCRREGYASIGFGECRCRIRG